MFFDFFAGIGAQADYRHHLVTWRTMERHLLKAH
jgi:hypothetical protein